jgi:phosphopantetheinyl transferase
VSGPAPTWLTRLSPHVPPGDGWLAPAETDVQSNLRFAPRRAAWRLGRWTAKQAILRHLGEPDLPPARVAVLAAPDGAPEALLDGAALPLSLSLTHREDRAVAALLPHPGLVGCDLEQVAHREPSFAETYLTVAEQGWAAGPDADLRVTLAWSAKEAALKHARAGLRRDTRSVELTALALAGPDPWRPGEVRDHARGVTLRLWWRPLDAGLLTVVSDADGAPTALDAATEAA